MPATYGSFPDQGRQFSVPTPPVSSASESPINRVSPAACSRRLTTDGPSSGSTSWCRRMAVTSLPTTSVLICGKGTVRVGAGSQVPCSTVRPPNASSSTSLGAGGGEAGCEMSFRRDPWGDGESWGERLSLTEPRPIAFPAPVICRLRARRFLLRFLAALISLLAHDHAH